MDTLKKYDSGNSLSWFERKKIASVFRGHDAGRQQKILDFFRQTYKESFFQKLIFPGRLVGEEALKVTAENTFEHALFFFFEQIRKCNAKISDPENYIFLRFQTFYHLELLQKLRQGYEQAFDQNPWLHNGRAMVQRGVTSVFMAVLRQLEPSPGNYLMWHYVHEFTIAKIGIIQAMTSESVKKQLCQSRRMFTQAASRLFDLAPYTISDEEYCLLTNYFENNLSGREAEQLMAHVSKDYSLQTNFELELHLRYSIDKVTVLKSILEESMLQRHAPFQTVEEFTARVKLYFDSIAGGIR